MEIFLKIMFKVSWILLVFIMDSELSNGFKINKTYDSKPIVVFDPYVSIPNKYNPFRYSHTDMIPFIKIVSSKFQRVCVKILQYDLNQETSLSLAPEAVARFNQLNRETLLKMEVWMQYVVSITDTDDYQDHFTYYKDPIIVIDQLNRLAGKCNQVFNDTVTTMLLPYKLFSNFLKVWPKNNINFKDLFTNVRKWGLVVDNEVTITDLKVSKDFNLLQPDVIFYSLQPVENGDQLTSFMKNPDPNRKIPTHLSYGYTLTIPDTDVNGKFNMANTVSIWNTATHMSAPIILSKAFDTPYEDSVEGKTSGWWRLLEDPNYNSTADYKFIQKSDILNQTKSISKDDKLSQPPKNLNVSKDHVAIIFSLYDQQRAKTRNQPANEDMNELLNKVATLFRKIVILVHDSSPEGRKGLRFEVLTLHESGHKFEITMLFLPGVHSNEIVKGTNSPMTNVILKAYMKQISTYILPYVCNDNDTDLNYSKNNFQSLLKNADLTTYSFGYTINISLCTSFDTLSAYEKDHFNQHILAHDVTKIVIFFEESEETTKLGTERMFNQTIALCEQCRHFLAKKANTTRNIQLSYMMLHYGSNSKFYESKVAIKTFIEYWQKLSDWAKRENTTVILNNAIDTDLRFKTRGEYVREPGWWKYQDGDVGLRIPSPTSKRDTFIDKIEYMKWRSQTPTVKGVTMYTLLAIIILIIIIALFVIVAIWVWNRQVHRANVLTKTEVNDFLEGKRDDNTQVETCFDLPYNRDHYEVTPEQYKIYWDMPLGLGEFCNVYKGKLVRMDIGAKFVAVKMTNPNNVKKSEILGILPELKVLSYVGKHENIVELFGANTCDLRIGQLYIFVEFCELGSLYNYLRKMRPSPDELNKSEKEIFLGSGDYVGITTGMVTNSLDNTLQQDMYRWSREICCALAYLASKHVVVVYIATRSILLNKEKVAKIGDFRCSMYSNSEKKGNEPLPGKWMSPESLRSLKFNEKSDIWAYGVTLWEIYTLGEEPYPELTCDLNFVDMLESGLRLTEPKYNDENDLFNVMQECWHLNPADRPTFADLQHF